MASTENDEGQSGIEIERSWCEQTVECDSFQSEHSSSLGKGKLNNISVRKQLFFFILRHEGH